MVKRSEKIILVSCQISKTLHDEIKYAYDNLNSSEKQKRSGKKKEKYKMYEASHKIGKFLFKQRKKKTYDDDVFSFNFGNN